MTKKKTAEEIAQEVISSASGINAQLDKQAEKSAKAEVLHFGDHAIQSRDLQKTLLNMKANLGRVDSTLSKFGFAGRGKMTGSTKSARHFTNSSDVRAAARDQLISQESADQALCLIALIDTLSKGGII